MVCVAPQKGLLNKRLGLNEEYADGSRWPPHWGGGVGLFRAEGGLRSAGMWGGLVH